MKLQQMNDKHRKDVLTPIVTAIEQRVVDYWDQFKAPIALSDLGRCHTSSVRALGLLSFTYLLGFCKSSAIVSNRKGKRFVAPIEHRDIAASTVLETEAVSQGIDTKKQGFLAKFKQFKGG